MDQRRRCIDADHLVSFSPERKLTLVEIMEVSECLDLMYENAISTWSLPETQHDRTRIFVGENEFAWMELNGRSIEECQQQFVDLHREYGLDCLDEVWDTDVLGRKYYSITKRDFETLLLMCDTPQGRRLRQLYCQMIHLVKLVLAYEDKWREHAERHPDVYDATNNSDLLTQMRHIIQDYDATMHDLFHCAPEQSPAHYYATNEENN